MTAVAYPLWRRVTELSADLHINQTELTKRAGVRLATFTGWKTATRPPQARLVSAIVDALNARASELARGTVLDKTEARQLAGLVPPDSEPTSDDIRRLIRLTQSYTDAQRAALLQIIDSFDAQNSHPGEGGGDNGT